MSVSKALVPVVTGQQTMIRDIYHTFQQLWDLCDSHGTRLEPNANWKRNGRPYAALKQMKLPFNPRRFYYFTDGCKRGIVRSMSFGNMAVCFAITDKQYFLDYLVPVPEHACITPPQGLTDQLNLLTSCLTDLLDDVETPVKVNCKLF